MPKIIPRSHSDEIAQRLVASGIAPLLAHIYAARGITDRAQLETGLSRLLPWVQMKNAQQMAVLLAEAIVAQKNC